MARYLRLLSVLTALALLLAACGGNGDTDEEAATETATNTEADTGGTPTPIVEETRNLTGGEAANFHGEEDVTDDDDLDLELDDNYFEPTILVGRAGQELELNVFNEGGNIHNFSLSEQDISQDLDQGESRDVQVTFPDSGAVTFFCQYHAELGMRGELRVAS